MLRHNAELNQIKHIIESKISHAYLDKYIKKPTIDMDKLFLLSFLFNQSSISKSKKHQYIVTIMLIELGLNIHDTIAVRKDNQMCETELQLSVLAGDYFSGQYYYLLSQIDDIAMIQLLASAIKEKCERKMTLYFNEINSLEQFFRKLAIAESYVFEQIAKRVNMQEIIPIIQNMMLIQTLELEKSNMQSGNFSYVKNYIDSLAVPYTPLAINGLIECEINKGKQSLEELIFQLPFHYSDLKSFFIHKFNLNYKTKIAEEG